MIVMKLSSEMHTQCLKKEVILHQEVLHNLSATHFYTVPKRKPHHSNCKKKTVLCTDSSNGIIIANNHLWKGNYYTIKNTFIPSVARRELFRNNIPEKVTQLLHWPVSRT